MTELLPTRATFTSHEPVEVEVRHADGPVDVSLWHLDRLVAEVKVGPGDTMAHFGRCPEGGYGVEAGDARTAVEVLDEPLRRLRYGFVADFAAGRDPQGVVDMVRRYHLNAILFYDWMYRHAQLLPPYDEFEDALGRRVSLATVRTLVAAIREAGSLPFGYAAVYAAGREHWPDWNDDGLYRADGTPWTLGDDFLWIVDPTSERWAAHFGAELAAARDAVGFAGFHLDQFGAPKRALRRDGTVVDLAEAFPALIDRLDAELSGVSLVFNNVNDFPTWTTAATARDAVYIEVWPPHDRLDHLGGLVSKARALAPSRSVALAAYLSVFDDGEEGALEAMLLELATVLSHGGSCLLHGEEAAVLTDPYYVRNHPMDAGCAEAARSYYDFGVRYGDLLFDERAVDVTRTHLAGQNLEVMVEAQVPVTTDCRAGAVWARVVRCTRGLLVSLIDLSAQTEVRWNAPKRRARPLEGVRVAVERTAPAEMLFASPRSAPALRVLTTERQGNYDVASVPPFTGWGLVWVRDADLAA